MLLNLSCLFPLDCILISCRDSGILPEETDRFFSSFFLDYYRFFCFIVLGKTGVVVNFEGDNIFCYWFTFGKSEIADRIKFDLSIVNFSSSALTYFLNFANFLRSLTYDFYVVIKA